ncbi:hypothetical protein ACH4TE_17530 [Streptomyces sioyaensis]|uniref:hypothetical protein n=1 Tax=Streptomyces sioyaensis TaxID=67364 RepID=UPI0037990DBE
MTSILGELADSQFSSAQIVAALARGNSPTALPVSALAQVLFLNEAEMFDLYGATMTAAQVVEYARNCPATHIVTLMHDEGGESNV